MANGNTFEPTSKYSSPSLDSQITLKSEQAIRVFRRCFETAGHSLFVIDVVSRALANGSKDSEYSKVEGVVSTMLSDMEQLISNETERLNTLLEANGQGHQNPSYSKQNEFSFKISSPVILRFATILLAFDHMITRIDTAWLCGLIDTQKAMDLHKEKLHWIQRVVRKLQAHSTAAIKRGRQAKLDQGMLDNLQKKGETAAAQLDADDDALAEAAEQAQAQAQAGAAQQQSDMPAVTA
ncbi:hypothetical protein IPC1147_33185 [Pseudomonas aeruginosa]|uniref:AcaB family transcriptional regulator n=1 Tax=Pseudomonas aeruginosa TaxID=287 RepID=UPI000FFED6DB|nr:AcaB family transcriptional regulator [Pseudomonas aeruginosa]MBA5107642.1 DUF1845 family protein [Pseudomonas aeruginosa]MBD1300081.1 DUF1845 family protein [Pseudomonas aeruginosa]MBD1340646.1 DUF1845 family protein [Pseudomonas aeruginosa]MCO2528464.1 DUF1845 domain-containing protein [Pseudomonas aeruginosa]MCO2541438.1 DUF1845 domain-containing protein [Pseudomonas aeruginosa]